MSEKNILPNEPDTVLMRRQSFYSRSRKNIHPLEIVRMRNFIDNITPWDLKKNSDLPDEVIVSKHSFKREGRVHAHSAPVLYTNSFSDNSEESSISTS